MGGTNEASLASCGRPLLSLAVELHRLSVLFLICDDRPKMMLRDCKTLVSRHKAGLETLL